MYNLFKSGKSCVCLNQVNHLFILIRVKYFKQSHTDKTNPKYPENLENIIELFYIILYIFIARNKESI